MTPLRHKTKQGMENNFQSSGRLADENVDEKDRALNNRRIFSSNKKTSENGKDIGHAC